MFFIAVNCRMSLWSECEKDKKTQKWMQTRRITRRAKKGGKDCPDKTKERSCKPPTFLITGYYIEPEFLPKNEECGLDDYVCKTKSHNKVVSCYWRTFSADFTEELIGDQDLCTHLVYSFAGIDSENDGILLQSWIRFDFKNTAYRRYLKETYPDLKVMIIFTPFITEKSKS